MTAPMLSVEELTSGYGDSQVLFGMGFEVAAGEVVTLMGRNGMGKTTTVSTVMGLVRPTGGTVLVEGEPVQGLPPYRIAQRGLGLVPEGRQVFPTLSVEENLVATSANRRAGVARWTVESVVGLFPRLGERRRHLGGQLSGGEQQMLVIGRALLTRPKLITVDEPSLGLAPKIVDQVYEILERLRQEEGVTLLIVEQSTKRALDHAERLYVLRSGMVQLEGRTADLSAADVERAYFGFDEHAATA
ncbi:MAG: ABC transporter ATP-binding protein [Thalassobaculum sp.]|uniref:ABC transporter ATP-binding protein n=1 Tax=Thalassobaculum sp. TaxID=2022740 RepID=UPI0032EABD4E